MNKPRTTLLAAAVIALSVSASAYASDTTIQVGASLDGVQLTGAAYQSVVDAATASSTAHSIATYDHIYTSSLGETSNNYAFKSVTSFGVTAAQAGSWSFQAAIDFGNGGALFVDGVAIDVKSYDLYTGGNSSQTLDATLNLAAGNHTVALYGLEGCCGAYYSASYSINGAGYQSFSSTDGLNVSAVPEPETYAMLLGGLGLVGAIARRRKSA